MSYLELKKTGNWSSAWKVGCPRMSACGASTQDLPPPGVWGRVPTLFWFQVLRLT